MPKFPVKPDPAEFAARLNQAFDRRAVPTRGRGATLRRRHKVSTPTASNWLNGKHLPDVERVWVMARDLGVSFGWLYFAEGDPDSCDGSHATRLDHDSLRGALHSVRRLGQRMALDFGKGDEAGAIARAYEHLAAGEPQDDVVPVILDYIDEHGGTFNVRRGPDGAADRGPGAKA